MALLSVKDLAIHYPVSKSGFFEEQKVVRAVDGVSFELDQGKVLGVVGESGCGKSTVAKGIMGLVDVSAGEITLMGRNLCSLSGKELRAFRQHFQMVFQDPEASLNPRLTRGEIIGEPLRVYHPELSSKERLEKVQKTMLMVGLSPSLMRRFPHEFSGGQKQRISIARSISISPSLLICDESVSALDASVQAQILALLLELQSQLSLTYLFISHDLAVVRYISDEILVMYLGKVVEKGTADQIMDEPVHPYTVALINAAPEYGRKDSPPGLTGEIPSPLNPPPGCAFSTRCPLADERCRREAPTLRPSHDRVVACHLV